MVATPNRPRTPRPVAEYARAALERLYREKYGQNASALARALGVSAATISKSLSGESAPGEHLTERIAEEYQADVHALLGLVADPIAHRSNEDKRIAVQVILHDPKWRHRSNRWIARMARVDPKTVASIRRAESLGGSQEPRQGMDGKCRKTPKRRNAAPAEEPQKTTAPIPARTSAAYGAQ
jgi:transcriptional regulator with XRE-family HTH domain